MNFAKVGFMHPHDGVHLRPKFVTGDRPYILLHGYFNAGGVRRHNLKKDFLIASAGG